MKFKIGDVITSTRSKSKALVLDVDVNVYKLKIIKSKKFEAGFIDYFTKRYIDVQCVLSPKDMLQQRLRNG